MGISIVLPMAQKSVLHFRFSVKTFLVEQETVAVFSGFSKSFEHAVRICGRIYALAGSVLYGPHDGEQ